MKTRKEPLRKCVATGEMLPKEAMLRIVKNKQGEVFVDPTGKAHGRGAYVKKDQSAIKTLKKKNGLDRVFQMKVDPSVYEACEAALSDE
ncbi:MAG: RNase P modulator RnpM [Bacillota bacterium]